MFASLLKLVTFLTVFIDNNFMLFVRLSELLLAAEIFYPEIIKVYIDIDCFNVFSKYISI